MDRVDPRAAMCSRYQAQIGAAPSPPFDVVQQIFDDNCTTCHSAFADLDLSRGASYAHIVGHSVPSVESCGGTLVVPGDPASSYLYQKLTVSHPCAGSQMPLDEFFMSQPLPDCMTSIVRDWIQAGAQPCHRARHSTARQRAAELSAPRSGASRAVVVVGRAATRRAWP